MAIEHKEERAKDIAKIVDSLHPKKIVVAGPGTGKSFLFTELIKKKRLEGKHNFLAITFIGKLGDALADDLCGLATTSTMHGFARSFVLRYCKGWVYYPRIHEVIAEDLKAEGVDVFEIGDENYLRWTKHYKAVGDADVVHYAVKICKKDPGKTPQYDLILIDEYQDFNSIEAEFVDVLAERNELVIVGDDDQALYGFKGSSPAFIRMKFDPNNGDWEKFTLRFCSRCTEVVIKYFHALVEAFKLNSEGGEDIAKRRIEKKYICYLSSSGGKDEDSKANPNIHLIKNCPVGMIAYKIRKELETIVVSQKAKDVLIIGEGQSCEALLRIIARQLKNYGFKNVDYRGDSSVIPIRQTIVDAYGLIAANEESLLGWRLIGNPANTAEKKKHLKNSKTLKTICGGTPSALKKVKDKALLLLEDIIEDWEKRQDAADDVQAADRQVQNEHIRREVLLRELKNSSMHLGRPLRNLDVTVCNILNSKGLGADIVFLIGFDQGKFPGEKNATQSEIYQMLVAITRMKKRLYLVNTIKKPVSSFGDYLITADLAIEEIKE